MFRQAVFITTLALLLGLIFLNSPGTTDVDIWRRWAKNGDSFGLVDGFSANQADYPPLATAILLGGYRLFDWLGFSLFEAIKLTILIFLLLTTFIFWLWTRDIYLALMLYGSLLLNSVALGYIDIFFAPSLVLALWMLKKHRWGWFSLFFACSFLTKWQPILIAPFLGLYILNMPTPSQWRKVDASHLLRAIVPSGVCLGLVLLLFKPGPIWQAFRASTNHEYLSGNALNINWIITHFLRVFRPEEYGGLTQGIASFIITADPRITILPRLLFYLSYIVLLVTFLYREKTFNNLLWFSTAGFLSYYTFNTGVHENHLFLTTLLAAILIWEDRGSWPISLILILMNNINLFLFYGIHGTLNFSRPIIGVDIALVLAFYNVLFFLYIFGNLLSRPHSGKIFLFTKNVR